MLSNVDRFTSNIDQNDHRPILHNHRINLFHQQKCVVFVIIRKAAFCSDLYFVFVISGNGVGDETASTMALIRSAFGSYVSDAGILGLMGSGLYQAGGSAAVIRVPAQRLSAAVCVGQPAPVAAAACRLSAMMFPWMRERKDGLTRTY